MAPEKSGNEHLRLSSNYVEDVNRHLLKIGINSTEK
jgi:hypothetical protein